jgi:hypothetical protein
MQELPDATLGLDNLRRRIRVREPSAAAPSRSAHRQSDEDEQ